MSISGLLSAFVADPGPTTLDPLRRAVLASPGHRADLEPERTLAPLIRDGDHEATVRAARAMLPGALLSPSLHLALAHAYTGLARPDQARRETTLARAAVAGILASGDGGLERPWVVLRLSDEYDVLRALGTRSTGQSLIVREGRSIDRHETTTGAVHHFDVTALM